MTTPDILQIDLDGIDEALKLVDEANEALKLGSSLFHEATLHRIISIVNVAPLLVLEIRRLRGYIQAQQREDLVSIVNLTYAAAVKECEHREHDGTLRGNGHHMAQKIAANMEQALIDRGWTKV